MIERTTTKTVYECEHCGTQYKSADMAIECEHAYKTMQQFEEFKPWMIYMLHSEMHGDFPVTVKEIEHGFRHSISGAKSCRNMETKLHSAESNDVFTLPNWNFVWCKSFEDAYRDHGILPNFHTTNVPDDVMARAKAIHEQECARVMKERGCDRELALLWIEKHKIMGFAHMIIE